MADLTYVLRASAAACGLVRTSPNYRQFRTDRIAAFVAVTGERYPRRRQALVKEWRAIEGLPAPY